MGEVLEIYWTMLCAGVLMMLSVALMLRYCALLKEQRLQTDAIVPFKYLIVNK